MISAIGADVRSPFFYSRVKGELEQALVWLNFRDLQIFRPSLLLGKRSENRIAERTATMLEPLYSPLLVGPLARYRPVYAETVARAMNEAAKWEGNGATWYDTVEIDRLAKGR